MPLLGNIVKEKGFDAGNWLLVVGASAAATFARRLAGERVHFQAYAQRGIADQ